MKSNLIKPCSNLRTEVLRILACLTKPLDISSFECAHSPRSKNSKFQLWIFYRYPPFISDYELCRYIRVE